jgi:hypothetical protein
MDETGTYRCTVRCFIHQPTGGSSTSKNSTWRKLKFRFRVQIIATMAMKIISFCNVMKCGFHKRADVSEILRPHLILIFSADRGSRNV